MIWDQEGNDRYHAAMWARIWQPAGVRVLEDAAATIRTTVADCTMTPIQKRPATRDGAKGSGAGPRDVANGGIGVILDGGGDDTYEFDYIAHGGGYWLGLGFARDFGGNDQRLGATRKMYNGDARRSAAFSDSATDSAATTPWGSCLTTRGTIRTAGQSWAWDLPGTVRLPT